MAVAQLRLLDCELKRVHRQSRSVDADDDSWVVAHSPCFLTSLRRLGRGNELFGHQRRGVTRQRLTAEEGRSECLHREHQDEAKDKGADVQGERAPDLSTE